MRKNKLRILLFLSFGIFSLFYFAKFSNKVFASNYNCSRIKDSAVKAQCERIKDIDCNKIIDEVNRKSCKNKDKKVATYLRNLRINEKTQGVLATQLARIDQQTAKNQQNLQQIQAQLEKLTRKINQLKIDITEKEKEINSQKKILIGLMQSYYDYDQQGLLEVVLLNKKLASSFNQADYIQQTGIKVTDVLANIQNIKQQLTKEKKDLQASLSKNKNLNNELKKERNRLLANKNQKQSLLAKTQDEKQKYKAMLANIEAQKKQLFDFSSASNINSVWDSISNYNRPNRDKWLISFPYFSQRTDSRWKNKKIGDGSVPEFIKENGKITKITMENLGCAVASVAMMQSYYGNRITPNDILKKRTKNFDGLLIRWSAILGSYKDTGYGYRNYKSLLKNILADDGIAIVHIHVYNGGHFVVVGGYDKKEKDFIVHDPYFGANIYLGTSLSLMKKLSGSNAYVDRVIYK